MPKPVITIDLKKAPKDQKFPIHNRWHPDIPFNATVSPGDDFRIECLDWTGGQIRNDDNAKDVRDCNLLPCHHLSGPVEVTTEGAREQIDKLAKKYLGQDKYPWRKSREQRLKVLIEPEQVDASGFGD